MMKQVLVFLAVFAAAQAYFAPWQGGLKVKFGLNIFGIGSDNFISLPRTLREAKNARWVQTRRPYGPMPSLVLYCPSQDDRVICVLFDHTEYVVGIQIAVPVDAVSNNPYSWEGLGFTLWSPPITSMGRIRNYWAISQYFVNEAILARPLAERLAAHNPDKTLQHDHVWVTAFNRARMAISVHQEQIADTATSHFTEQECSLFMGRHYYYNMTTSMDCITSNMLPWFPLVHSGELIGIGFGVYGELDRTALVKDYFETSTRSDVEFNVPHAPECIYNQAESPGVFTMHIYFIDAPWLVTCFFQDEN